jgi:AraC-like DNA-binding protein
MDVVFVPYLTASGLGKAQNPAYKCTLGYIWATRFPPFQPSALRLTRMTTNSASSAAHVCGYTSSNTAHIGSCGYADPLYLELSDFVRVDHQEARDLMAQQDEKAKAEIQHIASIVCSRGYSKHHCLLTMFFMLTVRLALMLPAYRRIFHDLTKEQRMALYETLGPLFTPGMF